MENDEEKFKKYLNKIEKNEKSSLKRLILLSSIPVLLASVFLFYVLRTFIDTNKKISEKNKQIELQEQVYDELKQDVLNTFDQLSDSTIVQLDSSMRQRLLMTKNNVQNLPTIIFEGAQTVVRYYERENDDPRIREIIEQMGFYLNLRPVKDDITRGRVNVIYYGDSVKTEEVESLAKALIKTNNAFRELVNYRLSEGYQWKINAIEIGYNEDYDSNEVLTEKLIESKLGLEP